MYIVTHKLTQFSWQVNSKEELLNELDILHAKYQREHITDTISIVYKENHNVINQLELNVPFDEDIDDLLVGFGQKDNKKTKVSLWKRLFHRQDNVLQRQHDIQSHSKLTDQNTMLSRENNRYDKPPLILQKEDNRMDKTDKTLQYPLPDKLETLHKPLNVQDVSNQQNIIIKNSNNDQHEDCVVKEDNLIENIDGNKKLSQEATTLLQIDNDEKNTKNVVTVSQQHFEMDSICDNMVTEEMSSAIYRTSASLSIYDLQRELIERVEQEIKNITQQQEKLEKQKRKHMKLLESLEQVKLLS